MTNSPVCERSLIAAPSGIPVAPPSGIPAAANAATAAQGANTRGG